jgi:CRP/FNR family transcriptional regulator, cyclic AMP receptor protein
MTTLMTPAALAGCLIASLVFVVPLRALAIVSNIAFIGYGYLGELWPIVILHAAMLPLNIYRLRQEVLLGRRRRVALATQWHVIGS